jgi:hypothetical protein
MSRIESLLFYSVVGLEAIAILVALAVLILS